MKFIKNKHNKAIINLDKVAYIYPTKSKTGGKHVICFVFDSMNEDEVNEMSWGFDKEGDFDFAIGRLEIAET